MRSAWRLLAPSIRHAAPRSQILVLAVVLIAGCAGEATPEVTLRPAPPASARPELMAAAEALYTADTPEALRAAVERARAAAPSSAIHHELAAALSKLEVGAPGARFEHAYRGLLDPSADVPHLRIARLVRLTATPEERAQAKALLLELAASRPEPAVRAHARRAAAQLAWGDGELDLARRLEQEVRTGLEWRVLGTFDNEQGQGFDAALPPERQIDLDGRYEGTQLEIGWREIAESPIGPSLDLGAALSPARWALAYALTAFEVGEGGAHELRVSSSVPLVVWLDGARVLSERVVTHSGFDQWVVPLELAEGRHRILVKSAQNVGPWVLGVRITGPGGAPASLRPLPPGSAPTGGGRVTGPVRGPDAAPEGGARALALRYRLAEARGLRAEALSLSDRLLARHPQGILPMQIRAGATWDHGERGKASDLVERLAAAHGDALPFFHLQAARLARQEGFQRKARAALARAEASIDEAGAPELDLRWARQLENEGWTEDRARRLEAALSARPGWIEAELELAEAYAVLGFEGEADAVYARVLEKSPGLVAPHRRRFELALDARRFEVAARFAERLEALVPHRAWPRLLLAEVARREKRWAAAEAALLRGRAVDPDAPAAWRRLGHVRAQAGDVPGAIEAWKASLHRNPDDDGLASRLSFLAPGDEGRWAEDVPDEAAIAAALEARASVEPAPGAHVLNLLDHEVTILKPDGSTTDVVTLIVEALDETGRDQLTKIQLRRGGRLRLRAAYVVGPGGERTQVSSVRGRVARFRNLSVGSKVVLQYRHDGKPVGYLARHMARGWWFQGSSSQTVTSEWVLWLPAGSTLHEWVNDPDGRVTRTVKEIEGMERVSWRADDVGPLVGEPNMPTLREVALNLLVSTVPDWATFLEWERALLAEAFRDDAKIDALAREVAGDAQSPREKALRIHAWLMKEIRYQQDYETHIAGVRPHAAPVVIERSYGDCKDKSVLFITLARQVGLEARFALVRTRPKGPLLREIPMQQFDHAIVYVPAQPGLEAGFFVDSTADALDLTALRQDDVGTTALVLEPEGAGHAWREIPFRPPSENAQRIETSLAVSPEGAARGALSLMAEGAVGSGLRRLARNERALEQAMQGLSAQLYGGAVAREVRAVETEDLRTPAHLHIELEIPSFARTEGRALRTRLPPVFDPKRLFQLESREHALVLGAPQASTWVTDIELAPGLEVARPPPDARVEAPCFLFERESSAKGGRLRVEQRYVSRCERIEVEDYAAHREKAEAMMRALDEELVLRTRRAREPG